MSAKTGALPRSVAIEWAQRPATERAGGDPKKPDYIEGWERVGFVQMPSDILFSRRGQAITRKAEGLGIDQLSPDQLGQLHEMVQQIEGGTGVFPGSTAKEDAAYQLDALLNDPEFVEVNTSSSHADPTQHDLGFLEKAAGLKEFEKGEAASTSQSEPIALGHLINRAHGHAGAKPEAAASDALHRFVEQNGTAGIRNLGRTMQSQAQYIRQGRGIENDHDSNPRTQRFADRLWVRGERMRQIADHYEGKTRK